MAVGGGSAGVSGHCHTLTIWGLPHYPRPIGYEAFPQSFVTPTLKVLPADVSQVSSDGGVRDAIIRVS